jgi:ribosomal protein S18 acetylase RimI-like enzyme
MDGFSLQPIQSAPPAFPYRVYASTREEELGLAEWPPEQKEAFLRMQFDLRDRQYRAAYPEARTELILCGGVPAGIVTTEQNTRELRLVDLALLPEFRGRGVGSDLLRGLQSAGKKIVLHVLKQNPAVSLYTRLGFTSTGEDAMYLAMEWIPG